MQDGTRDRLMGVLQEHGRLEIFNHPDECTLAELASMVIDLGIDPHQVLIAGSTLGGSLVVTVMPAPVE